MLDSSGNVWVTQTSVTVPAGQSLPATIMQRTTRDFDAIIAASQPFYAIEVPQSTDGSLISGIQVTRLSDSLVFTYEPRFINVDPDETVYSVDTDEYRRLYVRFGFADVVGVQPGAGEHFILTIYECAGDVRPDQGSPFALETTTSLQDSQIKFNMDALLEPGAAPVDITTLRDLVRYPSVYDENAVFLGEFDFLVRRNLPDLRFLSIWNEQIEERARGPSIDNINVLHVSVVEPSGGDLATTKLDIARIIQGADDSYRIKFTDPVDRLIQITINASVSVVNDPAAVASQISALVLKEYGIATAAARRGMLVVQHRRIYDVLRKSVPALTDAKSDLFVQIIANPDPLLPEHRQYVSSGSLTINVLPVRENLGNWGV